jgi:hypothetical protein
MSSDKNKVRNGGQEITLMTVLANEATGPSRKILKEYGQSDAKNYKDLELKLAELYFNTQDKVELEKKLADIHPHKNWILKNVKPAIEETSKQVLVEEVKSNATGDCMCPQCQNQPYTDKNFLNAEGPTSTKIGIEGLIVPMMLLGLLGITYVFVLKAVKNQ